MFYDRGSNLIDETTYVDREYVANVLVDLMHEENCSKSYLLTCEELRENAIIKLLRNYFTAI